MSSLNKNTPNEESEELDQLGIFIRSKLDSDPNLTRNILVPLLYKYGQLVDKNENLAPKYLLRYEELSREVTRRNSCVPNIDDVQATGASSSSNNNNNNKPNSNTNVTITINLNVNFASTPKQKCLHIECTNGSAAPVKAKVHKSTEQQQPVSVPGSPTCQTPVSKPKRLAVESIAETGGGATVKPRCLSSVSTPRPRWDPSTRTTRK